MALADQQAHRFGHQSIGSEHILLGLLLQGSGVVANVLKNLQIDLGELRMEVVKLVPLGDPEVVTAEKLPYNASTVKVLEQASLEARAMHDHYIGTDQNAIQLSRTSSFSQVFSYGFARAGHAGVLLGPTFDAARLDACRARWIHDQIGHVA